MIVFELGVVLRLLVSLLFLALALHLDNRRLVLPSLDAPHAECDANAYAADATDDNGDDDADGCASCSFDRVIIIFQSLIKLLLISSTAAAVRGTAVLVSPLPRIFQFLVQQVVVVACLIEGFIYLGLVIGERLLKLSVEV